MTPKTLAERIGVHYATVLTWLRKGDPRIRGHRVPNTLAEGGDRHHGGLWVVDEYQPLPDSLPAKRLAALRGLSVNTIYWQCKNGRIRGAHKIGNEWHIPKSLVPACR